MLSSEEIKNRLLQNGVHPVAFLGQDVEEVPAEVTDGSLELHRSHRTLLEALADELLHQLGVVQGDGVVLGAEPRTPPVVAQRQAHGLRPAST